MHLNDLKGPCYSKKDRYKRDDPEYGWPLLYKAAAEQSFFNPFLTDVLCWLGTCICLTLCVEFYVTEQKKRREGTYIPRIYDGPRKPDVSELYQARVNVCKYFISRSLKKTVVFCPLLVLSIIAFNNDAQQYRVVIPRFHIGLRPSVVHFGSIIFSAFRCERPSIPTWLTSLTSISLSVRAAGFLGVL